jgi:hypothetical protein
MSCHLLEHQSNVSPREREKRLRTIHDELHIFDESMNDLKCLSSGHASLVEGEPVQPLENILDLAFS